MRAHRVRFAFAFLSFALVAAGCRGSSDDNGEEDGFRQEEVDLEAFNAALAAYIDAAGAAHVAAMDAVRAGSLDLYCLSPYLPLGDCVFHVAPADGTREPLPFLLEWLEESSVGLGAAALAQRRALARAHSLYAAAEPLLLAQSSQSLRHGDDELGTQRQPLIFITLGALIGAVMLNKALNDTMDEAVAARTEPVRSKIRESNEETLAEIKEELGLDASTTREETLAWYERQPVAEKLDAEKRVESTLIMKSVEDANIQAPEWQEISDSVLTGVEACGKTAVTQVAGWVATGAGGQGISQVAGYLGAGQGAAFLIDVAVSVNGLQPLDLMAMAVSSETEQKTVAVAPAAETPTIETALEVLVDPKATSAEATAAADALIRDVVSDPAVEATTLADGSVTSAVPTGAYIHKMDQPTSNNMMIAPNLGPANMIFGASDCVPDLQREVLIDEESVNREPLVYEALRISDFVDGLYESPTEDPDEEEEEEDEPPTGMYVTMPLESLVAGANVDLQLHCGAETTFPATLQVTGASASGVSVSWPSPVSACPLLVLFSADVAATYDLVFTLVGASGERQTASTRIVVHAEFPTCDQSVFDVCWAAADADTVRSACNDECALTIDEATEQRDWQLCSFRCDIVKRGMACDCGNQSGCTDWTSYQHTCCVRGCQIDNIACLDAIDPEMPQDFFGNCTADLGQCWNACPAP